MPTIYEMAQYLEARQFFIGGLTPEAIFYYYNKCMMALLTSSEDF